MSNTFYTLTDHFSKMDDAGLNGIAQETVQQFPLLSRIPALPVPGTSAKLPTVTALPGGEFRADNEGRANQGTATVTTRDVTLKFYDASWSLDEKVASGNYQGIDAGCAFAAKQAMLGAMKGLETQIFTGTSSDGFDGLKALVDSTNMVVDAGGATATSQSMIFLVNFSGIKLALGNNGALEAGEILYAPIWDGIGGNYWAYNQSVKLWGALAVHSKSALAVIKNVDISTSGKTANDDFIFDAISKFHVGEAPDAIFMSRRSLNQLRKSRTATNATGAPAPIPTEVGGIPVYACETIADNMAVIS